MFTGFNNNRFHQAIHPLGMRRLCVCALLGAAIWLSATASPAHAFTQSNVGSYRIMVGVPHEEADVIHGFTQLSGWSPLYVDCYYHLGEVEYNSIWVKWDGETKREIFTGWGWWQINSRLNSSNDLKELLQVGACAVPGNYPFGQSLPYADYETLFAGVWTDETPSPTKFVYLPEKHDAANLYWNPEAPTFAERKAELAEDGFELSSLCVVIPLIAYAPPGQAGPSTGQTAFVTLFEKSSLGSYSKQFLTDSQAADLVDEEKSAGWMPTHIDAFRSFGAFDENGINSFDNDRFSVVTRADPRYHEVAWHVPADDVNVVQQIAYFYGMRPVSICGGRADDWSEMAYTIIFREIEVRVNDHLDPENDFMNDPEKTHGRDEPRKLSR